MIQQAIYPVSKWVNVLNGATAANGAPTLVTEGIYLIKASQQKNRGMHTIARIRHTATGDRSFTCKVWGWAPDEVDVDGDVVASTAGWVDTEEEFTLATTNVNGQVAQVFICLTAFNRLYCQLSDPVGTALTVGFAIGLTDD